MLQQLVPVRELLKQTFEHQAAWRREKAGEYPDDKRNLEAAELLDQLAGMVEAVPNDVLHVYQALCNDEPEGVVFEELMQLKHVGFTYHPKSAEEFLRDLIRDLRAKWPELRAV